ncbi:uncharacterized protein [Lolium perenne]|uniref:uncharacterized protein n=1 Tax=Lolium perenne TaxID=4522 RepID=UPI0021E9FFED|nr:uncharacterized protein LOC127318378 [Lolium perenne]
MSCSPTPSSPSALLRRRRERSRVSQLICATPPPPGTSVCPARLRCSAAAGDVRAYSSSKAAVVHASDAFSYVIGRSDEDLKTPFGIEILDKLTQTWVVPTVVGA